MPKDLGHKKKGEKKREKRKKGKNFHMKNGFL